MGGGSHGQRPAAAAGSLDCQPAGSKPGQAAALVGVQLYIAAGDDSSTHHLKRTCGVICATIKPLNYPCCASKRKDSIYAKENRDDDVHVNL